nr:hypothetical protein [Saccharofermentans sp.]
GEDQVTIEDVYEPFLLQNGFIQKTPRGRMLTKRAFEHLGLPMPEDYIARTRGGAKPSAPDNITIEEWTANNGGEADN